MMPTSSLAAPEVVLMTNSGAASRNKVGIKTTLLYQCQLWNHISLYLSNVDSQQLTKLSDNEERIYVAYHVDGLVQDCSNSSALAMELLQACTEPSYSLAGTFCSVTLRKHVLTLSCTGDAVRLQWPIWNLTELHLANFTKAMILEWITNVFCCNSEIYHFS